MESNSGKRDQWGSKFGFIMAAAGSAIGLGNVWRFPYITGKYGGGALVVIYLLFVIFIGTSVMARDRAQGAPRLRRLVQEARRRRVAARRLARLLLRLRHTFLLLRHNRMDGRIYVQVPRRAHGAGGCFGRSRRRVRRLRLRPGADHTLPHSRHGLRRRRSLPRNQRRHRA